MHDVRELLAPLRRIHEHIRDDVVRAFERQSTDALASVASDDEGDTIYAVDRVSEEVLLDLLGREVASKVPVVLVAEGLPAGKILLPDGAREEDAVWRIIVDPIDGTRCLMYQKRSAWVLTGVARNRGDATDLTDVELALQTEIPTAKQHLADAVWAIRDGDAAGERYNRLTGERRPLRPRPSSVPTIEHGYAMIARFFPGARDELAAIDEEIVRRVLGPVRHGKAHCFEDQYTSTGGQLYELMCGHDRFVADIRPLIEPTIRARGASLGICCHPYDICTESIARRFGVVVTDVWGEPLRAPLAVDPDVAWVGYANAAVRRQVEPVLQAVLRERGYGSEERR